MPMPALINTARKKLPRSSTKRPAGARSISCTPGSAKRCIQAEAPSGTVRLMVNR